MITPALLADKFAILLHLKSDAPTEGQQGGGVLPSNTQGNKRPQD